VSTERIRLGFTWRPPLVKQDVTIAQEHQRLQFANDLIAMAIDTMHLIAFLSNSEGQNLGRTCKYRIAVNKLKSMFFTLGFEARLKNAP
jgi:hypothetical protein